MQSWKRSRIGWTDLSGGPLNFVVRGKREGECECSPGCAHCYSGSILRRFRFGPEETTFYPEKLAALRMAKVPPGENRRGYGSRPMAFVCDMGDLCHPRVGDAQILAAFALMEERRDIDWQILTKRIERLRLLLGDRKLAPNIWVGTTIEDQEHLRRYRHLRHIRAVVRFVSIEPMLSPVDLSGVLGPTGPDWVIVGAESGPERRLFRREWADDVYRQCRDAGVAFFGKQDAGLYPGKALPVAGREIKEWPDVRVRVQ